MRLLPIVLLFAEATISKKKGSKEEFSEDELYEESKLKPKKIGALKTSVKKEWTSGPIDSSVQDRRLIVEANVPVAKIIQNHNSYSADGTKRRNFQAPVLAYVTPWNNRGYDIVKIFHKFSLVSPVWFQMLPDASSDSKKINVNIQGSMTWMWVG